jgi:uncharacterized protein (TIGR03083 family)
MTTPAIAALEQEVDHARALMPTLTVDQWTAASGCEGWRVQDVVQHMAAVFQQIADASSIDVGDSGATETSNEVPVQERRDWTVDRVVAAYDEWAPRGIAALAALQEPPMADTAVPIADLGTYPLRMLGNAITFDHYCHLRHDIGAAVEQAAALPQDEATLAVTLEWMLAGLPQMAADALAAAPPQPVNLVFEGPAGGAYVLEPADDGWVVREGLIDGAPTVHSTVHDFVSWGTRRTDWRTSTTGVAADSDAAVVLDAVNVI